MSAPVLKSAMRLAMALCLVFLISGCATTSKKSAKIAKARPKKQQQTAIKPAPKPQTKLQDLQRIQADPSASPQGDRGLNHYSKPHTTLMSSPSDIVLSIPRSGLYTGAYCPDPNTGQVTEKSIADFEVLSGKHALFVPIMVDWLEENAMGESSFVPFPVEACQMIRNRGSIPVITWQPNIEATDTELGFMLDGIANGESDEHVRAWAKKIQQYGGPIFLRWAHEMNGDWFSWSGAQNGKASGPARYRKAWIHIQDIFREQGVKNVQWIWSVGPDNVPPEDWNDIRAYWPGDDRVDWIGVSAFNWSKANRSNWKKWSSFSQIVDTCYRRVTTQFVNKPLFLVEWACSNQADSQDGDKALWIRDAFKVLPQKYPRIKAACWYNASVGALPGFYPANFTLDFSPHAKAYAQGLASNYFLAHVPRPKINGVRLD